ncbi:MAG TPA: MgtC/SapB family protein [Thermoanaerobaculia bacterium]|nr:MgtC/SapB family protein [Thermoanaerobaculia bacterium]
MSLDVQLRMLVDVALAMFFGAFIGLERELRRKAAGLRTHMLVAGAAAMLVEGARALEHQFLGASTPAAVRFDPVPVITAVVTAVGFLGAGTIIRQRDEEHIEGLTTAASMLFAATVGASTALRQYPFAAGATLLALGTLHVVGILEKRFGDRHGTPPRS